MLFRSITNTFSSEYKNKYFTFLSELMKSACSENDDECINRAKRTVIDYCRTFVRVVCKTDIKNNEKIKYIKEFVENKTIVDFYKDYPLEAMPHHQAIFHKMIIKKHYRTVIFMSNIRENIRKIIK